MVVTGIKAQFDLFYTKGTKEDRKYIKFIIGDIVFCIFQI